MVTPSRITNIADKMIILSDAAIAPVSVARIIESHFSLSNRGPNTVEKVYQRMWVMKKDGLIRKIDTSSSMLNSEYAITARGLAKLEGRSLDSKPVVIKPKAARKERTPYGIKVRNPNFRIESRVQL